MEDEIRKHEVKRETRKRGKEAVVGKEELAKLERALDKTSKELAKKHKESEAGMQKQIGIMEVALHDLKGDVSTLKKNGILLKEMLEAEREKVQEIEEIARQASETVMPVDFAEIEARITQKLEKTPI